MSNVSVQKIRKSKVSDDALDFFVHTDKVVLFGETVANTVRARRRKAYMKCC